MSWAEPNTQAHSAHSPSSTLVLGSNTQHITNVLNCSIAYLPYICTCKFHLRISFFPNYTKKTFFTPDSCWQWRKLPWCAPILLWKKLPWCELQWEINIENIRNTLSTPLPKKKIRQSANRIKNSRVDATYMCSIYEYKYVEENAVQRSLVNEKASTTQVYILKIIYARCYLQIIVDLRKCVQHSRVIEKA